MTKYLRTTISLIIYLLALMLINSRLSVCHDSDYETYLSKGHFTNVWAIKVSEGHYTADKLANELGFQNLGVVSLFVYHSIYWNIPYSVF